MHATSSGNATHTIGQLAPLTLAPMITTLRVNFKDPMRRRYVAARLGGKMIGVTGVLALIYASGWYFSTHAGASVLGQASVKAADVIDP